MMIYWCNESGCWCWLYWDRQIKVRKNDPTCTYSIDRSLLSISSPIPPFTLFIDTKISLKYFDAAVVVEWDRYECDVSDGGEVENWKCYDLDFLRYLLGGFFICLRSFFILADDNHKLCWKRNHGRWWWIGGVREQVRVRSGGGLDTKGPRAHPFFILSAGFFLQCMS